MEIEGDNLERLDNEAGGHRIQRVPPTEKRGRVQTSTVTVAILSAENPTAVEIPLGDFRIEWFSGTGSGGQHRNKHQNCCRLVHKATGRLWTGQTSRDRLSNQREALAAARRQIAEETVAIAAGARQSARKDQIGSGMRGDKRRTYRFQDDNVKDDITGKSARCTDVLEKGRFELLW